MSNFLDNLEKFPEDVAHEVLRLELMNQGYDDVADYVDVQAELDRMLSFGFGDVSLCGDKWLSFDALHSLFLSFGEEPLWLSRDALGSGPSPKMIRSVIRYFLEDNGLLLRDESVVTRAVFGWCGLHV